MRVIAGEARGRRLEALPGTDVTRPTLDQVKEAMFSIVQFDLPGARVLDLCREDLERLDGPEPEEGWLPYCYDFARRLLFPEKDARPAHGAGAVIPRQFWFIRISVTLIRQRR